MDYITKALSINQIKKRMDETEYITARIAVDLSDLIDGDIEWLNDVASETITGSSCGLLDISYKSVGVTDDGSIIIEVTGCVSDFLSDYDDENDDDWMEDEEDYKADID
jgi:hypothetical protein